MKWLLLFIQNGEISLLIAFYFSSIFFFFLYFSSLISLCFLLSTLSACLGVALTFAPALPQSTPSSPLPAPHNILARISFACADPLPGQCKLDHNSTLGPRKKEEPRRSSFFQLLSTISVLLELHLYEMVWRESVWLPESQSCSWSSTKNSPS